MPTKKSKPFSLPDFNARRAALSARWNKNIKQRHNGRLGDRQFRAAQKLISVQEAKMTQELAKSDQSWRLCDRTIWFQAPIKDNMNNHVLGELLHKRFPYVMEDSELGQGFVYCNRRFAPMIVRWLEQNGAHSVTAAPSKGLTYVDDPKVKLPPSLLARPIYDAYPNSDLLPIERPGPKVTVDEFLPEAEKAEDTLFLFYIKEAIDAKGDPFEYHNMLGNAAAQAVALHEEYDYQSQE